MSLESTNAPDVLMGHETPFNRTADILMSRCLRGNEPSRSWGSSYQLRRGRLLGSNLSLESYRAHHLMITFQSCSSCDITFYVLPGRRTNHHTSNRCVSPRRFLQNINLETRLRTELTTLTIVAFFQSNSCRPYRRYASSIVESMPQISIDGS